MHEIRHSPGASDNIVHIILTDVKFCMHREKYLFIVPRIVTVGK